MLIMFAIFVLFLSVKLTASFNWGCISIVVYTTIFAILFLEKYWIFVKVFND